MKWIDFENPSSVDDAVKLLSSANGEAKLLAGGTDLIVQMRAGALAPGLVVDVKAIPELNELSLNGNGLTVGAAVPCYKIYNDSGVKEHFPGLVDSSSIIGGTQIQGRASLGGNLCNAAPSGDSIPAMIAYGGVANITGPNGVRQVPLEEFCIGPRRTVLSGDEILISISFPSPGKGSGAHYMRFIPRNEMDIAVVGVGTSVVLDGANIKSARVTLASVAPTPIYVESIGDAIAGKPANESTIAEAGQMAKEAAKPITDMRGTIEYRKHLCDVLTRRSLAKSIERAKENN